MWLSYFVSLLIVVAMALFGIFISGAQPLWYLDVPSIIIVFLPTFALGAGDYGWRGIGGIAILAGLVQPQDPQRLGPNVAVALICFFYALMFNLMLIAPLRNRIALRRAKMA